MKIVSKTESDGVETIVWSAGGLELTTTMGTDRLVVLTHNGKWISQMSGAPGHVWAAEFLIVGALERLESN